MLKSPISAFFLACSSMRRAALGENTEIGDFSYEFSLVYETRFNFSNSKIAFLFTEYIFIWEDALLLLLSVVGISGSTMAASAILAATATHGLVPRTHLTALTTYTSIRRMSIRPAATIVTSVSPSAVSTLVASNGALN